MADTAQSTVDSLLGRLSSVLLEEAQLVRGVRGEVQSIKNEMKFMNCCLLDLADVENPNNQVREWMRQVQDLATDSQDCIDSYMLSLGARPPSAGGLLGCLRLVPHLARTMPTRHRIATQIRELKTRARELGERRLRYGINAPPPDPTVVGDGAKDEEEEERRRPLADVAEILEEHAREVIGWLTEALDDGDPRRRRLRVIAITRTRYQEKEHSLARRVFHTSTILARRAGSTTRPGSNVLKKLHHARRSSSTCCRLQQLDRAAGKNKQEPGAGVATASSQEQQLARAAAESKQEPGAGVATASGEEQQLAHAAAESKQEPEAGVATATGEEQQLAHAAAESKRELGEGGGVDGGGDDVGAEDEVEDEGEDADGDEAAEAAEEPAPEAPARAAQARHRAARLPHPFPAEIS